MNTSGSSKPIYVPVEYCDVIPGQRKHSMDERQQATMIRKSAVFPSVSCLHCLALLVPCRQHLAGTKCSQVLKSACRCSTMGLRHQT